MEIIALDAHKRYSQVCVQEATGEMLYEGRVAHVPGNITAFLSEWTAGSPVAVETVGNWYWIVDEIEAARMVPRLTHAHKAKLMLGSVNKTDKLDARGLNRLQQVGTLPTVWVAPGAVRDQRELPRSRMVFAQMRTRLKNRIHSVLDKYGRHPDFEGISDIFGVRGRKQLALTIKQLPPQTAYTLRGLLRQLDAVQREMARIEKRMRRVFGETRVVKLLMSLPGVGFILAVVIANEIGDIGRFASAARLASYSGMVPRVHSSGGHTRYGRLRSDVNRYLKWAYSEAGNSTAVNQSRLPQRHVSGLYRRIRQRSGHAKAIGAVGRHLAEASYWILTKGVTYKEPQTKSFSSRQPKRDTVMSPARLAQ